MGVINVTPDSFSDGGRFVDPARAEIEALRMQDEGVHLLDLGAESSRPGSISVSWREELRRLQPVLKRLVPKLKIPISVDTMKPEVAEAALEQGAVLVNDITGLKRKRMAKLIAKSNASVVLMHMQGTPQTMQKKPYYRNVVKEVRAALRRSAQTALEAGIHANHILIDPGFGFGKTVEHNFSMLSHLDEFASLGYPVLVGLSRKSFLGMMLGLPVGNRLHVSITAACAAILGGAHVLRVHDVLAHRQAAAVADRLRGAC